MVKSLSHFLVPREQVSSFDLTSCGKCIFCSLCYVKKFGWKDCCYFEKLVFRQCHTKLPFHQRNALTSRACDHTTNTNTKNKTVSHSPSTQPFPLSRISSLFMIDPCPRPIMLMFILLIKIETNEDNVHLRPLSPLTPANSIKQTNG